MAAFRSSSDCHNCASIATGWWVEARDAAKHPALHRTAPTTKIYLVNRVNIEKPCLGETNKIDQAWGRLDGSVG